MSGQWRLVCLPTRLYSCILFMRFDGLVYPWGFLANATKWSNPRMVLRNVFVSCCHYVLNQARECLPAAMTCRPAFSGSPPSAEESAPAHDSSAEPTNAKDGTLDEGTASAGGPGETGAGRAPTVYQGEDPCMPPGMEEEVPGPSGSNVCGRIAWVCLSSNVETGKKSFKGK